MSVNKHFNGAFSMGSSLRLQGREEQKRKREPGPGHFETTFFDKPTSMRTVFGTSKKGLQVPKAQAPPMNTYKIKSQIGEGLKYSMRKQLHPKATESIRTDNYTPTQADKTRAPNYSLGYKETAVDKRGVDHFKVRNGDPNGPGYYHKEEQDLAQEIEDKKVSHDKIRTFYNEFNSTNHRHGSSLEKRFTHSGFMSSSNVKKSMQTGLGIGERDVQMTMAFKTPGPGTYQPTFSQNETQREFRIGEKCLTSSKTYIMDNQLPGPGHYNHLECKNNVKTGKQFSLTGKCKKTLHVDMKIPGSQTYYPQEIKTQMRIQFGKGMRSHVGLSKFQESTPGPGRYFSEKGLQRQYDEEGDMSYYEMEGNASASNSKGFSFGKDVRDKEREKMEQDMNHSSSVKKLVATQGDFPGPGSYQVVRNTEKNDSRKFQLRGREEKPSKAYRIVYPGPGNYEQPQPMSRKNVKQGVMSKSARFGSSAKDTPGPGSYKQRDQFDGRHSSFGKINYKPEVYRFPQPGPGSYQVPSTIAQIPKYLQRKKDDEFDEMKDIVGF